MPKDDAEALGTAIGQAIRETLEPLVQEMRDALAELRSERALRRLMEEAKDAMVFPSGTLPTPTYIPPPSIPPSGIPIGTPWPVVTPSQTPLGPIIVTTSGDRSAPWKKP